MTNKIINIHNIYFMLFATLCLIFGLFISQSIYPIALYSVLIAIIYAIFLTLHSVTVKLESTAFLITIMTISITIKIFAVIYFDYILTKNLGMPYLSFQDDFVYNVTSSNILENWQARGFGFYDDVQFNTGFYSGYPNLSALAKYVFGDHYLVPRFMNVFFSTITIPFFYYSSKILNNSSSLNKTATILLAFSPVFITYSSLQLKDTVLVFFVSSLIYGTLSLSSKGVNLKNTLIVLFSITALVFFRAAIILPYFIALFISFYLIRKGTKQRSSKLTKSLWIIFIFFALFYIWDYLYSTGLLSATSSEYFDSRFADRGKADTYEGSNDLNKLGILALLLGPIFVLFSLFLPVPTYINLDSINDVIPYHYLPLLEYYAILPMAVISLMYIVKNRRLHQLGFFIVAFLILYKVGQASSKSIFDSRQSLPAIYTAYLLLSYFDLNSDSIKSLWKRYYILITFIMLIVAFFFTFLRFVIR